MQQELKEAGGINDIRMVEKSQKNALFYVYLKYIFIYTHTHTQRHMISKKSYDTLGNNTPLKKTIDHLTKTQHQA